MADCNGVVCPACGSDNIGSWQRVPRRFICRVCSTTFQPPRDKPESGAMFEGTDEAVLNLAPPEISCFPTDGTMISLFDAHLDPQVQNHPSFEIAMRVVEDIKPQIIVIGGDWIEVGSLSFWDQKKRFLMEGRRYDLEISHGHKHLEQLRYACPDARMIFFEGNHEYRVPRYTEEHSELQGKLNVKRDLDLDDLGIEWVPFNDVIKIGKLNILHGIFYNVYFARSTLDTIGESCLFGHSHKSQTFSRRLHNDRNPHVAQGVGCLCDVDPRWKQGKPTNYVNSFAITEYRANGHFNNYEVFVVQGAASYGGDSWQVE